MKVQTRRGKYSQDSWCHLHFSKVSLLHSAISELRVTVYAVTINSKFVLMGQWGGEERERELARFIV